MKARLALLAALLAVVALAAIGCSPNPYVNYRQWVYPATVMSISSICPSATPTTYVGHDPSAALAVDFMTWSTNCGYSMANWAVHLAQIGGWHVHYICYRQHIWNIQRAGEGWRLMPDRGSPTANHYDHVHVSMW